MFGDELAVSGGFDEGDDGDVVLFGVGGGFFVGHVFGGGVAGFVAVDARVVEFEVVGVGLGPELG